LIPKSIWSAMICVGTATSASPHSQGTHDDVLGGIALVLCATKEKKKLNYGTGLGALIVLNKANATRLAARAPKPASAYSGTTKNPPGPPGVMSA
jgi:hypothetical protein